MRIKIIFKLKYEYQIDKLGCLVLIRREVYIA